MRFGIAAMLLVLALSATPQATSCAVGTVIPPGTVVTPDCTYIVEQTDPGVWMDNLKQYWVNGLCSWMGICSGTPFKVNLEDLHIGRWQTGG